MTLLLTGSPFNLVLIGGGFRLKAPPISAQRLRTEIKLSGGMGIGQPIFVQAPWEIIIILGIIVN